MINKFGKVLLVVMFFVLGGFAVSTIVNADASTTSSFPFFHMNYDSNSYGQRGCGGALGWMMDDDEETLQTYLMIFPSLEGIDHFAGESLHVTVVNSDTTIYSTDDYLANPGGAVGVYVPNDFNGSIIVTYGDFEGTTTIDFTDTLPCLAYQVNVTLN